MALRNHEIKQQILLSVRTTKFLLMNENFRREMNQNFDSKARDLSSWTYHFSFNKFIQVPTCNDQYCIRGSCNLGVTPLSVRLLHPLLEEPHNDHNSPISRWTALLQVCSRVIALASITQPHRWFQQSPAKDFILEWCSGSSSYRFPCYILPVVENVPQIYYLLNTRWIKMNKKWWLHLTDLD